MSDIFDALRKPEWWFSTILVAVIANVASNYLYDWMRPRMAGRWLGILKFSYSTLLPGAMIWCSLYMPMSSEARFTVISVCLLGFAESFLGLIGFINDGVSGKALFMQMMTLAALSSLMFLEPGFSNALASNDTSWFASEIFTAIILSISISFIIFLSAVRKRTRKRQGLK